MTFLRGPVRDTSLLKNGGKLIRPGRGTGRSGGSKPPAANPYVALLLHMNGANGSTTFTDSSPLARSATVTSSEISTTQSKFGGASGHATASTAQGGVTYATSTDWTWGTSQSWCLEFWFYGGATGATQEYFMARETGSIYWTYQPSTGLLASVNYDANGSSNVAGDRRGVWTHIAICYNKATNKVIRYIDGTADSVGVGAYGNWATAAGRFGIMGMPGRADLPALAGSGSFIDELRITRNSPVYTANFTPQIAEF